MLKYIQVENSYFKINEALVAHETSFKNILKSYRPQTI